MEERDDEEITIDFSKIKNFFKKKKDKAESAAKEGADIKEKTDEKIDKEEETKLKEDKVDKTQTELKEQETKAELVDTKKKSVEKKPEQEKKEEEHIKEDDEEISIDFSKIKNFFKKAVKEDKEDVKESKESDDEEISFDFSKIKHFFKNIKKSMSEDKHELKDSDDETAFDFKKIADFTKKYYIFFLILIPLLLSIYLRAMPSYLPATDDWAGNSVYNSIRQQISSEIRQQYPNLPKANIDNLVNQRFSQVLKTNKAQIEQQMNQASAYFKSRLQKDGQTYLIAIDPYFWMRKAKNILENGHPGDELRNPQTREICYKRNDDCVPWNNHMFAPLGRRVSGDMFHSYLEAYLHKFITIFNPGQDLMGTAFVVPILLSALAVIPAFFIARRIGGNFGGFIAALFVAIHPGFLTRTVGGFSDTDAYNVLFPLFITWLFLEAFEAKTWRKSTVLSIISGFLVGVYAIVWGAGWWYIFDFILASLLIYIVIYVLINRDKLRDIFKQDAMKHTILVFLSFFIAAMIFTSIISTPGAFWNAFTGPTGFMRLKQVGITTVWPNVLTTVAEQNPASLNTVINQIGTGSLLLFLLSIIGIVLTLIKKYNADKKDMVYFILSAVWLIIVLAIKPQNLIVFLSLISLPIMIKVILAIYNKDSEIDFKLAIILIIWFTSTTYASTKGIRYMLLLVPAFSIGFGIALGIIYKYLSKFISSGLYLNKTLAKTMVIILLLFLLMNPYNSAKATARQEIPSMNDAWYESLDKINREAEPDAIINSWWDFGHWFKAIGDRAVTFDGTSQDTPMAHWIGNSLLTNDEDKAVGILRMLDCGSNTAFNKLDESIKDTAKSVYILHDIVKMDKKEAKKYLLDYVDKQKADEVLEFTHCDPPENYYITSNDMIGKSGVWGHFGSWNFNRALIYNTLKKKEYENNKEKSTEFLMQRFNYSREQAEDMYFDVQGVRTSDQANSWIAPWPSYASGVTGCRQEEKDILICPINIRGVQGNLNIRIDLKQKTAEIDTPDKKVYPNSIVFPTKEGIEKIEFKNNTIGYSMTLIPSGDSWSYIMMLPPLEDSIFTRLYFLDGHGLKKFKKFSEQRSVVGHRIVVWKVDWEGEEMNQVYFPEKNETLEEAIPEDEAEEITPDETEEEIIPDETETEEVNETISKQNATNKSSDDAKPASDEKKAASDENLSFEGGEPENITQD